MAKGAREFLKRAWSQPIDNKDIIRRFDYFDTAKFDIFDKYNCAVFTAQFDPNLSEEIPRGTRTLLTLEPQLYQYEFYRVMDSYTAYQELSMYIGGRASPEKPIPAIDDVTLAQAKGFDKFSFRKPKA